MATVGSIIARLQEFDSNDKIEDLLQKPEFQQLLAKSLKSLPKTSRATASKIVRNQSLTPPKQCNRQSKALNAILKVEIISLPSLVLEKYKQCQQCPSEFWTWVSATLDLQAHVTKSIDIFFCEAYLGIAHLEIQREWDTIQWRFFVLFFHDLVNSLGREALTKKFQDQLVSILSSSSLIDETTTNIQQNLTRWVAAGARYARLSDELDQGAPFLLPQSVTDKTWEKGLPLDGPIHTRAVEHLKAKQYYKESERIGADILGAKIRWAIFQPFRWIGAAFEHNSTPQQSNPPNTCHNQPNSLQYGNLSGSTGTIPSTLAQSSFGQDLADPIDYPQSIWNPAWMTALDAIPPEQNPARMTALDAIPPEQNPAWMTALDAIPPEQNPAWMTALDAIPPELNPAWMTALDAIPPELNPAWMTALAAIPPDPPSLGVYSSAS